jgi:hypothetical protein
MRSPEGFTLMPIAFRLDGVDERGGNDNGVNGFF